MRASPWTSQEVASAVDGAVIGSGGRTLSGVSTDTRDPLQGQLFVALVGERYDAHDFLATAVSGGAAALLVARARWPEVESAAAGADVILVDDTLWALGQLARAHRRRRSARVIALTGSNGKTTTKELIASILSASHRVLKTEGNLNNLIGVPMTLLGLLPEHEVAVVEMGMNEPGEIARYTELAEPDVGMVINVGPAHIGKLGSLEAIAAAKGELFRGLDPSRAIAVANRDDPRVMAELARSGVRRVRTFGRSHGADVRVVGAASQGNGQDVEVELDGERASFFVPFPGRHNAENAAAAIAAATALSELPVSLEDIRSGLSAATNAARRLAFRNVGRHVIVDDCYNANSASMRAALETVSQLARDQGRGFVALLGEMRELGDQSAAEHRAVGVAAAAAGARAVAAFGPEASPIAGGAANGGADAHHEAESDEAIYAWLRARLNDGDVVLVKGSRGIRMERFIERFEREAD